MSITSHGWPILLTEEEAASYLSVSSRTLARVRAEKKIAPRQLRGLVRYHRDDLDEFARDLPEVNALTVDHLKEP